MTAFIKIFGITDNKSIFRQVDFRSVLSRCIFKRRNIIDRCRCIFLRQFICAKRNGDNAYRIQPVFKRQRFFRRDRTLYGIGSAQSQPVCDII